MRKAWGDCQFTGESVLMLSTLVIYAPNKATRDIKRGRYFPSLRFDTFRNIENRDDT